NISPEGLAELHRIYPARPTRAFITGRAILDRAVVHIPDIELDPENQYPTIARVIGGRSILIVPMLREGAPIGAITVARAEPGPFSEVQIGLLQTFADQAVIAVENVRLFTELQEKNHALTAAHSQVTEALERQTATSEILRIISGSPTNLQPVLDAVAERAARLCSADDVKIHLVDGDTLRLAAQLGPIPSVEARPIIPTRHIGRAVLERRTIHVHDMRIALDEFPDAAADVRTFGARTALATPLLREGMAIGVIQIRRLEVEPFSEKQIALLETFADQAVIAIEDVRLFTELQQKNDALTHTHHQVTEALEQQTATSEILRVISSSPTDVQPVFDAIVTSSVRLCAAKFGAMFRFDGDMLNFVAHHNLDLAALKAYQSMLPRRPEPNQLTGTAILERRVLHVHDVESEPRYTLAARWRDVIPIRTCVV